jgi:hypothetical protein
MRIARIDHGGLPRAAVISADGESARLVAPPPTVTDRGRPFSLENPRKMA